MRTSNHLRTTNYRRGTARSMTSATQLRQRRRVCPLDNPQHQRHSTVPPPLPPLAFQGVFFGSKGLRTARNASREIPASSQVTSMCSGTSATQSIKVSLSQPVLAAPCPSANTSSRSPGATFTVSRRAWRQSRVFQRRALAWAGCAGDETRLSLSPFVSAVQSSSSHALSCTCARSRVSTVLERAEGKRGFEGWPYLASPMM